MSLLILVLLILLIFGTAPNISPWARDWGYAPSGSLGIILLVLVLWYLFKGHRF